ncbi:MAG: amino acid ABC transporter permease [Desulfovibrio sp.]|nr:amino acid ABC transporter permease [Desulfovibrio sp.]
MRERSPRNVPFARCHIFKIAEADIFNRPWLRRILFAVCAAGFAIWAYSRLAETGFEYEWQWNRAWRQFGRLTADGFVPGPLCDGLLFTTGVTFAGALVSVVCGLVSAIFTLSPWPLCARFARLYTGLFRNTPLLIQLFFVYFLISPLFNLDAFWSAVLTLGAFEGAYLCELFRASLLAVSRTQWEASLSLGFSLSQTLFLVILPQAFRLALPAFSNQLIALLKDTSLVSAIALADLTMRAQAVVAETFLAFEVWLIAALFYLMLSLFISLPFLMLEKYWKWR